MPWLWLTGCGIFVRPWYICHTRCPELCALLYFERAEPCSLYKAALVHSWGRKASTEIHQGSKYHQIKAKSRCRWCSVATTLPASKGFQILNVCLIHLDRTVCVCHKKKKKKEFNSIISIFHSVSHVRSSWQTRIVTAVGKLWNWVCLHALK